jgi:hypothetical protein
VTLTAGACKTALVSTKTGSGSARNERLGADFPKIKGFSPRGRRRSLSRDEPLIGLSWLVVGGDITALSRGLGEGVSKTSSNEGLILRLKSGGDAGGEANGKVEGRVGKVSLGSENSFSSAILSGKVTDFLRIGETGETGGVFSSLEERGLVALAILSDCLFPFFARYLGDSGVRGSFEKLVVAE